MEPSKSAADPTHSSAATASAAQNRHWPALDGLRAVAVFAVLANHAYVLSGGYLGVDLFFVLSGFLITTLLIDEWARRGGQVSLRDFYMRRMLRLFPALGCVIAASVILSGLLEAIGTPYGRAYAAATVGAVPDVVFFAGNWVRALSDSSVATSLGLFGHTWSLAVEEQFYLLWPALFVVLMRRRMNMRRLASLLAFIAVALMIYRGVAGHRNGSIYDRLYFGTDTHSDGLLLGCALAFWLASEPPRLGELSRTVLRAATWLATGVLAFLLVFGSWGSLPLDIPAAVLATAVIVSAVALGETPFRLDRLLSSTRAVLIGKRSYGIYLWHYVLITAARVLCAPYTGVVPVPAGSRRLILSIALAVAAVASLLAAQLSYRYVELPALRRKLRFGGTPVIQTPSTAVAEVQL